MEPSFAVVTMRVLANVVYATLNSLGISFRKETALSTLLLLVSLSSTEEAWVIRFTLKTLSRRFCNVEKV